MRQAEKQFLACLSDVRDPPAPEAVQRAYAKLVRVETALGDDGKDGRLAKLRGAYNDWRKRRSTDAVVEHVARVRAANGGELPPADCPPDDDRKARELQRAIEFATLVREAGQTCGAAMRGERIEPESRHAWEGFACRRGEASVPMRIPMKSPRQSDMMSPGVPR